MPVVTIVAVRRSAALARAAQGLSLFGETGVVSATVEAEALRELRVQPVVAAVSGP
jgi:ATP-dependent protease HslVU (ClpYQ) peptidase subunit